MYCDHCLGQHFSHHSAWSPFWSIQVTHISHTHHTQQTPNHAPVDNCTSPHVESTSTGVSSTNTVSTAMAPPTITPTTTTINNAAVRTVQACVEAVQSAIAETAGGSLLQVRCDEKGFLAIVAFGLPGSGRGCGRKAPRGGGAHPSEGARFALRMVENAALVGQQACVGLTTGEVLCAVVGGDTRAEYTVAWGCRGWLFVYAYICLLVVLCIYPCLLVFLCIHHHTHHTHTTHPIPTGVW